MTTAAPANKEPALENDVEPLPDDTARQAQRIVASYAADAEECRMLLDMLGIGPEVRDPADSE